jgi:hypothetical protein
LDDGTQSLLQRRLLGPAENTVYRRLIGRGLQPRAASHSRCSAATDVDFTTGLIVITPQAYKREPLEPP